MTPNVVWTVKPMRRSILAEQSRSRTLVTTTGAARMLGVTVHGIRWMARAGRLRYETTASGQRLFRYGDLDVLIKERALARLVGWHEARPTADREPRQLSLRLMIEGGGGERALRVPVAKGSGKARKVA
jgi:hypothetical protein